jgi:prophage DNA circulation protein
MTQVRDWSATLWPASFKGVPFFFESDDEAGGRAVKVHEFPNRDDPFIEDLGQKARYFAGTAYVTGDDADAQAITFAEMLASAGSGTLVIPIRGPLQVNALPFKRTSSKDKFGYIAFSVRFVRAGASNALASVLMLGQQIFDAADGVAHALANTVKTGFYLFNAADYVIAAAVNGVQGAAAAIEGVRLANAVDPDTGAEIAVADAALATAAPLLINFGDVADLADTAILLASVPALDETFTDQTVTLAAAVIATVRLLASGMSGTADAGAGAMLALALSFPPPVAATVALSPNAAAAAANAVAIVNLARVAALTAWCEALQRQAYVSRSDGVAARAAVAERLGQELASWTGAAGFDVYVALQDLQGATVAYLTQLIADLAPVVTVSAPQSMPSLWWSWRLYGDPGRAVDLVLRNQVRHPSFMPLSFAALAPGFPAPATLPVAWPAP